MTDCKVVILSAQAANLVPCVRALLAAEPSMSPADVIVVDDGARGAAGALLPGLTWVDGIRPFVFARNANVGIRAAGQADVWLLNDDARLETRYGLTRLQEDLRRLPRIGLCSAAVRGAVGNPNQLPLGDCGIRLETDTLAFVAVYIPRLVYDRVGPLDERFVGYGFEDNDYCTRAKQAGWQLAIADSCVVDHGGELPSTFRTRDDLYERYELNRRLYETKASRPAATAMATAGAAVLAAGPEPVTPVDLMYLACNRLEFTRETFTTLRVNTDWSLVHELFVYDDGSVDGTRAWLERQLAGLPCRARVVPTFFGSPVTALTHFIDVSSAPMMAKVDNDAMMPPGWLRDGLAVFERHPELDLLGLEAMYPHDGCAGGNRSYAPAAFISGLGLYRRRAFQRSRPFAFEKWFGLEEWQEEHGPELARGWITPAIEVFLLDRCPFEPWLSLTERYIAEGWMRRWPKYDGQCTLWQWRWPEERASDAA